MHRSLSLTNGTYVRMTPIAFRVYPTMAETSTRKGVEARLGPRTPKKPHAAAPPLDNLFTTFPLTPAIADDIL